MDIKFGTDGWRGVIARDFTFDNIRIVAQAIADFLKESKAGKKMVAVGYDKRFQSAAFAKEIASVLHANKLNAVLLAESLPTPAISLLTHRQKGLGVMVTASHNPPTYNGVKIKVEGKAAPEKITAAIEAKLGKSPPARNGNPAVKSLKQTYLKYVESRVDIKAIARKLKKPVIIDYMYGCGAGLLEEILPKLNLIAIHAKHDPLFGGINPEPVEKYLDDLKAAVKKNKALVGIALDGDADRIGAVDDKGNYLSPCQIFPLFLNYVVTHKRIKGRVIQSISMGYLAERIAKGNGLPFQEVPVGFKFIAEQVESGNSLAMGGEESGGYSWKGGLPERDALLSALLFLEMLAVTKKSPSQLYAEIEKKFGKSNFKRVDFRIHKPVDKSAFVEKIKKKLPGKVLGLPVKEVRTYDGVKIILENDFWLLMRPSGTEPLIRTYAETDNPKKTHDILHVGARLVGGHVQ